MEKLSSPNYCLTNPNQISYNNQIPGKREILNNTMLAVNLTINFRSARRPVNREGLAFSFLKAIGKTNHNI
jgi:hypothetical protein